MISCADTGNVYDLRGLSTDEKPTKITVKGKDFNIGNGSTFIELDTGKVFCFDGENRSWGEL